ncbi:MAG: ABC transporter permease [Methanosarcinales archaeon]|nr:ABC transporter permease [Methanosarcinales archaeon]
MVNFVQSLNIAVGSIRSAKIRSILTTLGIVIGVAAVIANVSLGASFQQYFDEEIGSIGSNFIVIDNLEPGLFYENELELVENIPGIVGISPIKQSTYEVTYQSTARHLGIMGVSEDYEQVANLKLEEGSFLNDKDKYVAIIGSDVAYEKFDRKVFIQNPIDITFRKDDGSEITQRFKVKGILKSPETTMVQSGIEPDERIFIPISTWNEIMGESDCGGFFAMASSMDTIEETSDDLDQKLGRHFGVPSRDMDNDDAKPYLIFNQAEILEETDQLAAALGGLLTSVALIALVVGSIGIMNIMLVSVTERTREIGILKSLGFTKSNILFLFIVESIVLSVLGGLFGTGLGVVGAYGAQTIMNLPNTFPVEMIVIGFAVSVIVGLIAGVYPANKAAKMNPVEALRSE